MDTLSHALAGAMIADALPFTGRLGEKAPLVAALAAVAPDLDMLPAFIANFPPSELSFFGLFDVTLVRRFHRAWTHSVFITTIAAFPLGYAAWRWSGRRGKWWQWGILILLALYSHIFLDLSNVWGVRMWLPFSPRRSALAILPFIDPWLVAIMGSVLLLNHAFRNSYPPEDDPGPRPGSLRERTAAVARRLGGPRRIAKFGLALAAVRVAVAFMLVPSLAGWL